MPSRTGSLYPVPGTTLSLNIITIHIEYEWLNGPYITVEWYFATAVTCENMIPGTSTTTAVSSYSVVP